MIIAKHVSKTFTDGENKVVILKDINLSIETGKRIAIIGPSGSGKSTLLSILAGLDKPTTGEVIIDGVDIATLDEKELALFRNKKMSIVFQAFELVQFFTAYENVMLPLSIRNEVNKLKVDDLFRDIGLTHRKHNMPSTLSGGEQQRIAIARALASGSELIFADEPTGNLDAVTGKKILDLFLSTIKENKKTFIVITHDMNIAKQMDAIYEIRDRELHLLPNKNDF
jgi:putative ABC transport system ATP-binding protein